MKLLEELTGAKRIGIGGHLHPDGDCTGACLSLYRYLKNALPEAFVQVLLEKPEEVFARLAGYDEIESGFPELEPFDVFFALDCNEERLGEAGKYFRAAVKTINIDHHITNGGEGMVNLVRPDVGSCCEVLYDLFAERPEYMDGQVAEALYTGIVHDTGVFQYSNTRPETHRIAAGLISCGFDFPKLILETFYERTYLQAQLLGRALMESIRFLDGHCIVSALSLKTLAFYNAAPTDLDGIVNHLRNIAGIDCAIFMYQTGVCEYKVSVRTTELVDAARVVSLFGGGGHARAAGCILRGTFHDCVNNLSLNIEQQLKEAGVLD